METEYGDKIITLRQLRKVLVAPVGARRVLAVELIHSSSHKRNKQGSAIICDSKLTFTIRIPEHQ